MKNDEIIKAHLTEEQIRTQMAEETAELYQALSKWQRAHENVPGYQVSEAEAIDLVVEEMADVALRGNLLGIYAMPNVRPPADVHAAKTAAAELLWTLESHEAAATKISALMGRVWAWAETRGASGVIAAMCREYMEKKEKRWAARLTRWAEKQKGENHESV